MTNKTDENFYCESFYRINSIIFFLLSLDCMRKGEILYQMQ